MGVVPPKTIQRVSLCNADSVTKRILCSTAGITLCLTVTLITLHRSGITVTNDNRADIERSRSKQHRFARTYARPVAACLPLSVGRPNLGYNHIGTKRPTEGVPPLAASAGPRDRSFFRLLLLLDGLLLSAFAFSVPLDRRGQLVVRDASAVRLRRFDTSSGVLSRSRSPNATKSPNEPTFSALYCIE